MLQRIIEEKRREIRYAEQGEERELPERPLDMRRRNLLEAIRARRGNAVIAEIKRRSPSAGSLRPLVDPASLASAYQEAGAAAVSVLTDRAFFWGSPQDLVDARHACRIPVLRKDFMIGETQVRESAGMGADAVLLIAAALSPDLCSRLMELSLRLDMVPLLEVHSLDELRWARELSPPLLGINCRDLSDMSIDPTLFGRLAPHVPEDCLLVAESGIEGRNDVLDLRELGADAFLVGSHLMRSPDPSRTLRALLGG
jgi:indole-3-glycerol phosphate synthase